MLFKFLVFQTEETEDAGAGVIITVETADYHRESFGVAKSVIKYIEDIKGLTDSENKKRTDLSVQRIHYDDREHPQGTMGIPHEIE